VLQAEATVDSGYCDELQCDRSLETDEITAPEDGPLDCPRRPAGVAVWFDNATHPFGGPLPRHRRDLLYPVVAFYDALKIKSMLEPSYPLATITTLWR